MDCPFVTSRHFAWKWLSIDKKDKDEDENEGFYIGLGRCARMFCA